jgi:hypothetical protein
MTKEKENIISEIQRYIGNNSYSEWYVGITDKPEERLFEEHAVNKANESWWYYADAGDSDTSRKIEEYFIDQGTKGGPGGGDYSSSYVYAYKITSSTRE